MAAEEVVWNNLTRILEDNPLLNEMRHLENLKKSVEEAKDALSTLQENDNNRNKLRNLGALLYQSDDLVDEISTFKHNAGGGIFPRKVGLIFSSHNPIYFPLKLGWKVKRICQQIGELTDELHYEPELRRQVPLLTEDIRDFVLAENKVIGRSSIKLKIREMLLRPKTQITDNNATVIPIFGVAGVGKSTLAKYVYDDKKVSCHFDLKIWIQVSHITKEEDIVREIVEACTNNRSNTDMKYSRLANVPHARFYDLLGCQHVDESAIPPSGSGSGSGSDIDRKNEIDILERRLKKEIEGKLYLLILDDASILQWLHLKDLLSGGARGSHVLVTTRSEEVPNLSKSQGVESFNLQGLTDKDRWSLFKTFAFGKTNNVARESNALFDDIGKKIANKCKGVPLAVKVAASLLYGTSEQNWEDFYEGIPNNLVKEEEIMNHVLEKSFAVLPLHLKACFGYCSLFPDDFNFNKRDLISLWTAQGYVDQAVVVSQNLEEEKVAEKYFLELTRRCFFQDVSTDELGHIVSCKMHRIMRELACKHMTGAVNMYVKDSVLDSSTKHVSFTHVGDTPTEIAPFLIHAHNLRTLVSVKEGDCDMKIDPWIRDKFISSLNCLRVLDFHDLGIEELPDSIGKLIHLRYLDLSRNGVVTLPNSITQLYKLHTLKLNSCLRLKSVPGNFGKLVNLKRFEIDECDSLASMPIGLQKLVKLETLSRFVVSKDCSTRLQVLKKLVNLRGRLEIELSENWETNIPVEAQQAESLLQRNHLEELKISWAKTDSKKLSYQQLLEQLQPNSKLKILCIQGYKGDYFPSWAKMSMLARHLPLLEVVSIEGCGKCEHLPPFGELQHLRKLTLRHMTKVEYVEEPAEDVREDHLAASFFPCLQELTLHNFYKLERWRKEVVVTQEQQEETRKFPSLSKLKMWNCPKLKSMPLFEKVVDLDIRNINPMLLEDCGKRCTQKSIINNMRIRECHNLTTFSVVREGLGGLPILKELVIERCDELHSLVSELRYLKSLERLEISGCKNLNLSCNEIITETYNNVNTLARISGRIGHHLNEVLPTPWRSLNCLLHLNLREITKMENLPEGLKHVRSLRSLWISACPALKALPQWIGKLTALQHLRIENCPNLKTLPEELKQVKFLMKVEITECPELLKRCKEHTGEDWHKIKHAQVLLHKSWRYGLMSEQGAQQNRSNVRAITDVKYFIVPVITAEAVV